MAKTSKNRSNNDNKRFDAYVINGERITNQQAARLEKKIAIYEKLNKLVNEHVSSLQKQADIEAQIEQYTETIGNKYKQNIKWSEEEYKQQKEKLALFRQAQKEDILGLSKSKTEDRVQNLIERANRENERRNNKLRSLSSWYNLSQEEVYKQKATEIFRTTSDRVYNNYRTRGEDVTNSRVLERMNEEINEQAAAEIEAASKNFGKWTNVFSVATQVFDKSIDIFKQLFSSGLKNQKAVYEDTITSIITRTGTSRGTYLINQAGVNNTLSEYGLRNNIATSDVQQMWNSLANIGVNEQQMYETALDNVITRTILPYLDTTSLSVNLLNERLDNNFVKQIRGINAANLDIAGSNYITEELLNKLIDQVQPMSDEAIQNLAANSTQVTAIINYLMSEKGLSKDQATSYATSLFKQQQYGGQILSTGTPYEKYMLLNQLSTGTNIYKDYGKSILNNILSTQDWASMLPGADSSTINGVLATAAGNALGMDWSTILAGQKTAQGNTLEEIQDILELSSEELLKYSADQYNLLKDDKLQSAATLQETTVENLANELAVGEEWLGHWTDLIITAIEAIGTIILTKVVAGSIGKGISALAGLGSNALNSTSGLGGLLGTAGPIVGKLGVIGVAVGLAAAAASAIANRNLSNGENQATATGNMYSDYISGNYDGTEYSEMEATIKSLDEGQQRNKGGFWSNQFSAEMNILPQPTEDGVYTSLPYGNIYTSPYDYFDSADSSLRKSLFGDNVAWWKKGSKEAQDALSEYWKQGNASAYNKIKAYILSTYLNSQEGAKNYNLSGVMGALMVAANYQGLGSNSALIGALSDSATFNLPNFYTSKEDIKQYLHSAGITEASQLSKIFAMLDATDTYFMTGSSGFLGYPNSSEQLQSMREDFDLLRSGLDEVPYDNYPALLHEGEAVLTASTANELRNLIEEYRNTQNNYLNMEAVVENQTAALCNKMDQIISNMTQGSATTTIAKKTSTLDNMLTFRSTKMFL